MARGSLKLSYIEEPDGHRIERLVVQQFRPWCDTCKRVVSELFEEDINLARRHLAAHMALIHKLDPADEFAPKYGR